MQTNRNRNWNDTEKIVAKPTGKKWNDTENIECKPTGTEIGTIRRRLWPNQQEKNWNDTEKIVRKPTGKKYWNDTEKIECKPTGREIGMIQRRGLGLGLGLGHADPTTVRYSNFRGLWIFSVDSPENGKGSVLSRYIQFSCSPSRIRMVDVLETKACNNIAGSCRCGDVHIPSITTLFFTHDKTSFFIMYMLVKQVCGSTVACWATGMGGGGRRCGSQYQCSLTEQLLVEVPDRQKEHELQR